LHKDPAGIIRSNLADYGAGLNHHTGFAEVLNCRFELNTAESVGGGIHVNFEALLNASQEVEDSLQEHRIVKGSVVKVGKDQVVVDIGYKSEGEISIQQFADTAGEITESYGMTKVAGLLKGLLLLSEKPLSLDEMAERLEVSKGSIGLISDTAELAEDLDDATTDAQSIDILDAFIQELME